MQEKSFDYGTWKSKRWKTAISRKALSAPMQLALSSGILKPSSTIFDFGCGKFDDCTRLLLLGISAAGFDPYYYPKNVIQAANVVSLLFVLNVIENVEERSWVLQYAWELTRNSLIIAVQPPSQSRGRIGEVWTKSGTYQKYFTASELIQLIRSCTNNGEIVLAKNGVVLVQKVVNQQLKIQL